MITGRQSTTVTVSDPDGTTRRKSAAFVSLVPVDDAGDPVHDNVGSMSLAMPAGSGGAGGPIPGEFRIRIPDIAVVAEIPDGAVVGFVVL